MQVKGKAFYTLGQQFQEMLAVMIVAKDALTRVAPTGDMIPSAGHSDP
jgi:hypothetical protein